MPRRGEYKPGLDSKKVEKAVKAHLEANKPVADIAAELKVTRQSVYTWVADYKDKIFKKAQNAGMTPEGLEKAERSEMLVMIAQLQAENRKLKDKLVEMMMSASK